MASTANYSWPTPDDTDQISDGASAIRTLGSAIDAQVFTNNAPLANGYAYAGTTYFTSSGTFAKADPLGTGDIGLRAVRVRAQGAGGGGGGAAATSAGETSVGAGGGSGVYAESLLAASSLASSVTVTVGAAGAGGTGGTGGNSGGNSSFGTAVTANGGNGGGSEAGAAPQTAAPGIAVSTGTGDLVVSGSAGFGGFAYGVENPHGGQGGNGAASLFGGSNRGYRNGSPSGESAGRGAGGAGARRPQNQATAVNGQDGGAGLVVVDCFV